MEKAILNVEKYAIILLFKHERGIQFMDDNMNQQYPYQGGYDQNPNNQGIYVNLNPQDMKSLSGWATFVAIINIISGALSCLAFIYVIPVVIGIIQIIAGVRLLNASDNIKRYIMTNNGEKISEAFTSFYKYFKLSGITLIIGICAFILLIIGMIIFFVFFASDFQDILNSIPNTNSF